MILAVDIGNTNIVAGGYENGALVFSTRLSTDRGMEADQYALQLDGILRLYKVQAHTLEGAIISSVVPQVTQKVSQALRTLAGIVPVQLSQQLNTGVTVAIEHPEELGADLLAGAIAAASCYTLPAIVLDLGTATKLTAVDAQGTVLGCSILPGLFISLNALTGSASLLGGISVQAPEKAIGTNSTKSMQSGLVFGTAALLDGMIDRFALEMGCAQPTLLATGGAAACIVPHCRHTIQHVPTLLLDGLYQVYKNNY